MPEIQNENPTPVGSSERRIDARHARRPGERHTDRDWSRREARRARNRRALLRATRELVGQRGVGRVIADLAARADIAKGSFYAHFEGKDKALDHAMAEIADALRSELRGITAGMDDAAEILSATVRHLLRRTVADPEIGPFVARTDADGQPLFRRLGPLLRKPLSRGLAEGRLRSDDAGLAYTVLLGASYAVVASAVAERMPADVDVQLARDTLRWLGLGESEARDVAARPLPRVGPASTPAPARHR